jgi:DNA polymerase
MERLAGDVVQVGLGWATVLPDIDFETYSEAGYVWAPNWADRYGNTVGRWKAPPGVNSTADAGLLCVGAAVYSEHPSCEVLTCSYDLKDGRGKRRWRPGRGLPYDLFDHVAAGGLLESHNAGFEWWIWYNVCRVKYGWPMIPAAQQRCSAAKARAFGLPGALDPLCVVLNTATKKDPGGKALIDLFSKPRQPDKKDPRRRVAMDDEPVQAIRFMNYCDTDIEAEAEASQCIPDLSPAELEWWQVDQLINRRGVHVDLTTINAAIAIIEQAFERYNTELHVLTGGAVERASELDKLKGWMHAQGFHMDSMDEAGIADAVKRIEYSLSTWEVAESEIAPLRRALEIRQLVGSASVKKLYAMRNQATQASRLHELFMYHAARTGRATGNGPQPTNLPNSGPDVRVCLCGRHFALTHAACPWCAMAVPPKPPAGLPDRTVSEWNPQAVEDAIACIRTQDLNVVEHYFGNAVVAVSGCLRGMYTAAAGYELICSDYSAIEAVVLAELAGEQWRIDLFKARGKIYEASGAKVQGLALEDVLAYRDRTGQHHPCRKKGKVLELACGFGGWIGALINFGADEFMTEEEMKQSILAWRAASPMIVKFWGGQFVDGTGHPCPSFFRDARPTLTGLEGMAISAVLYPGTPFAYRGIEYIVVDDVLYCTLLSGRRLAYHRPRLAHSARGGLALSYEGWNTNPKMGAPGWVRMDTYSGKLAENVTQATARDVLAQAVVRLWRAGYHTVLHVYDEIVAEVPKDWGSIEEFERLMSIMPAWAEGWPIFATDGWRGHRYRK